MSTQEVGIIQGMQQDEQFQWESVWEQHVCWLRTVLEARLRSSLDADEVLQDVAVLAWRKRDQLTDENRIQPWLYRIAISQVLMFWRKRKQSKKYISLTPQTELKQDDHYLDPADWICRAEAHDLVREAMAKLSPKDREILMLKHVESWTYEQISNCLDISYDKVVYRLSRARGRLRKQLVLKEIETS